MEHRLCDFAEGGQLSQSDICGTHFNNTTLCFFSAELNLFSLLMTNIDKMCPTQVVSSGAKIVSNAKYKETENFCIVFKVMSS